MIWLRARLAEPSTWAGLASILMFAGVFSFTEVSWWRWFIYAACACGLVATVLSERRGG